MEIIDIIKYFAKFPSRANIDNWFASPDAAIPGYSDLQDYINALPDPLIPDITDFIVGMDEEKIANRIRSIDGFFMYVEYGNIRASQLDNYRKRSTDFNLAVIIACHYNSRNIDNMAEALVMDNALTYMMQLAEQMKTDDALVCGNKRLLDGPLTFTPIPPFLLYQSYGWELSFSKTNNLLL